MAHTVTHQTSGFSFANVAQGLLAAMKSAYTRQSAYRRTFRELSSLTDRELSDIGVSRCMIDSIAQAEADRF